MGRAMLIICAGVLISVGIIGMSTADMGKLLTQNTATYANNVSAKNAAHTGIQMAMQKISDDTLWAEEQGPGNKWKTSLNSDNDSIYVYVEYLNSDYADNEYWESDSIRIVSEGVINTKSPIESRHTSTVSSVYLMAKFSSLVPPMTGPLQLPNGYGSLDLDGGAHTISGADTTCGVNKPPIVVASDSTKEKLDSKKDSGDLNVEGEVEVDSTLNYQPTDELIKRLENSGNATTIDSDYSENLGTPDDPGVFFVDGNVKLTGQQTEGYGIMVIKNSADMDYEDEEGNTLDIRGNFEFNGLVIFENADAFSGKGTPDINGSVLVGDTAGDTDININLGGNININYSCQGEDYSKMAAANTTDQNKYTRVVSFEETGY